VIGNDSFFLPFVNGVPAGLIGEITAESIYIKPFFKLYT
jgi:hypothetical protein